MDDVVYWRLRAGALGCWDEHRGHTTCHFLVWCPLCWHGCWLIAARAEVDQPMMMGFEKGTLLYDQIAKSACDN